MIEPERLKLGKGVVFVKGHLRRLPQSDEIWEADIRPLPAPAGTEATIWQGLVITHDGRHPNERTFEKPATVNDMASLLAEAMRRSLDGEHRRPKTLHLRQNEEWAELVPHLTQLGIRVVSGPALAKWDQAFEELSDRFTQSKPPSKRPAVEESYPTVAKFVRSEGHIEIGHQQGFGFVARAFDESGLFFEAEQIGTLADAMAALEERLADLS